MKDEQLLRYGRQILLDGIDVDGQQALFDSRALVIGLGGLGSPVAMYLAAAGVGHLTLVDHDDVDLSNLQRQIIHATEDLGRNKTASAVETVARLNPDIETLTYAKKLHGEALDAEVQRANVVIDATDNFPARLAINDACVRHAVPLVSGAAIRYEGQVTVFTNQGDDSPCYRCLFPSGPDEVRENCGERGVLAPIPGIIGSIQATEALKLLTGVGETLHHRLMIVDGLSMEVRSIQYRKDPACPSCGSGHD